jgi:uncharacterized protein
MEPTVNNVEFTSGESTLILRGRFIRPASIKGKMPLVIMLTGDGPKGTKSLSWTNLPPRLSACGIASFLFDFAGLGYSDGDRSHLTVSLGIENFQEAFSLAISQEWVDTTRIALFAASFGATVVLTQPEIANQTKMIGFKSPASFLADAYINEVGPAALDDWIRESFSTALGYDIEVLQDSLRHNVYDTAAQIKTRILITHGDSDEIVPIRQSKFLMSVLQCEKHLEVFPSVGHNYSEEGAWERMATLFIDWFHEGL